MQIFFLSLAFCFNLIHITAHASGKETAIQKVFVAEFAAPNRPTPTASQFQKELVSLLNKHSYWEALPLSQKIPLGATPDQLKKLPNAGEFSAILAGEWRAQSLKLSLKRLPSGSPLAAWTLPLSPNSSDKDVLNEVVDTLINDSPYRGFVVNKKGSQVSLNLGTKDQLTVGTKLEIFDFDEDRFGGDRETLGEITVIKTGAEKAVGQIEGDPDDIPLFSKVGFATSNTRPPERKARKYFSTPWVSLGGSMIYIDSKISENTAEMRRRLYQLTLTPFFSLGAGWGLVGFRVSRAGAENASNKVTFLSSELTAEVLTRLQERFAFITALGVAYWQFDAVQKARAELPLSSTTTYAPLLDQSVIYTLSPRSRVFANGQLQIPKISQDNINGSSQAIGSFGFRMAGGLRLLASDALGIENSVFYQTSQYSFTSLKASQELIYGMEAHLFYRF